ncbi:STM3941 family protein [[Mycobacterium] nativiensis]|uniref:STM3941 family protein n=1 Tax=[Mycobacterium] nativiensis TaxID=2855503 RepID=A0ABU5XVY0_9MYCO|nr:STM3941 family protein [Mycolicibacter sp. MYC340]MEB3032144.1 STM3941 family protein [Mycolicibacter sp. MYC340]
MPFEAHLDRRRVAQLVAISLAFVLGGVWLAGGFGPIGPIRGWSPNALHVVGWISIVFFGLGLAIVVPRLFQSGVEVRVDAEGVYGRRYSKLVIPWSAVERITTVDAGRIQYANLFVRDPDDYPPGGVAGWISRLGSRSSGCIAVSLQGTDGSLAEMSAAFDYFAPGKRDRPAAS